MPNFWRIDYSDGDFTLMESPSLFACDRLRAYHLELHKALEGLSVWPPEVDEVIYPQFKQYYQKVGDLLLPRVECDRLLPTSRHAFFVCTDPIKHPKTEQSLPGLSGLEQIMGYSYHQDSGGEEGDKSLKGTGDPTLDILTSAVLIFKAGGIALAKRYSREDLVKMCVYANELQKLPDDKDKQKKEIAKKFEYVNEVVEVDDPIFAENKVKIVEGLLRLGIPLPPQIQIASRKSQVAG